MRTTYATALLASLALAACGTTTTTTYKPPNLGKPTGEAVQRHSASGCGIERWAVKTLTDPAANQVSLAPQASTVAALTSIKPPVQPTDRVAPTETTVYRISGTITFAKQEADHDLHLVLQEGKAHMIVEVPDPACASGSVVADKLRAVRQAVEQLFPVAAQGQSQRTNIPVTVTGVGFFDRLHGQTGVAPNGIELHPLIDFTQPGGKP